MSHIMKMAVDLAGKGTLEVGKCLKQVTKAGTEIQVFNRGKGVMEKVVKKANGDTFKSLFAKNGYLFQSTGKNAKGTWNIISEADPRDKYNVIKTLYARVKGLIGEYKANLSDMSLTTDRALSKYMVKKKPGVTFNGLKKRLINPNISFNKVQWRPDSDSVWSYLAETA